MGPIREIQAEVIDQQQRENAALRAELAANSAKYERLVSLVERRGFLVTEEHGLEVRLLDDDLAARRNDLAAKVARIAELEAENARLREASKGLVWSKTAPTESGEYWWRHSDERGWKRLCHLRWCRNILVSDYHDAPVDIIDGLWAGPLPLPTEPN